MQGTARGRCFRFPHERPNEHSPYRMANESCKTRGPLKDQSGCRAPQEGAASASRTRDLTSIRHIAWQTNRARREARPRAEADAGHRKRALLPLPARETKRAFAISQGKRFVQREPHLPAIGNAARLHANELRPFLILLPYHNSRQPGDDLFRAVCCFFRFTKLN